MPGVCDVDQSLFVKEFAAYIKNKNIVKEPEFALFCKTSYGKELAPNDSNWFFIRMASMARRIYMRGHKGVGYFKRCYGTAKRNGTRPKHHVNGSGSVARKALQALEKMKIVKIDTVNGGRILTDSGKSDMDRVATKSIRVQKSSLNK